MVADGGATTGRRDGTPNPALQGRLRHDTTVRAGTASPMPSEPQHPRSAAKKKCQVVNNTPELSVHVCFSRRHGAERLAPWTAASRGVSGNSPDLFSFAAEVI